MSSDSSQQQMTDSDMPRDAKVVIQVLKSMGVEDFEPKVVNQLLEFMYRYVTEVLLDADAYREHRTNPNERTVIELSDVRLAIQARVNHSFVQPPPRQTMVEMARKKNATPLPEIPEKKYGVLLPHDAWCLSAVNYQIEPAPQDANEPSGQAPNGADGANAMSSTQEQR